MKKKNEKNYFEDWHIKIVDASHEKVLDYVIKLNKLDYRISGALQASYSFKEDKKNASLTILEAHVNKEKVTFENNVISPQQLVFEMENMDLKVSGQLNIREIIHVNQSKMKPGLMGYYKYLPFLDFYQEIPVLQGHVEGSLVIDGNEVDFTGGHVYMQKQWGSKFPNVWMWAQCMGFEEEKEAAFSLGVARLKVMFDYYTAFAIPVYYNNQLEIFSNYNGGQIAKLYRYKGYVHLIVIQKNKLLDIKIYGREEIEYTSSKETHGIRDVYECDKVKVEIKISEHGNMLWEATSLDCHIEMGGNTSKLK